MFRWMLLVFSILVLIQATGYGITKVGNSDDGSDLEGALPLESGPILAARTKAMQKLQSLNTPGIAGLGNLLPEVEKTTLYMARQDISTPLPTDQGHASMSGLVYARTLAQPLAATRFFPIAAKLEEDQLIALHVHEALHRALPESVREDEKIVAKITLAITAPQASHDSVKKVAEDSLPKSDQQMGEFAPVDFDTGSNVGYTYKQFMKPNRPTNYEVSKMHIIHSDLYPFGNRRKRLGMGIEMSMVEGSKATNMGPLGLSAKFRVFTYQGFQFSLWALAHLNTLSAEELKQSPYGRDVFTLGFAIKKELKFAYVENYTSLDFGGESKQQVGAVNYKYTYGSVIDVKIRAGVRLWKIDAGAYTELHVADNYKVSGGAFAYETGRYHAFSVGPEMSVHFENFVISLMGRILASSTKNANYDFMGDLMGPGVAQGSGAVSLKFVF